MWALRRRLIYSFLVFFALIAPVFLLSYKFFYVKPACNDGVQNGEEVGVDCGGSCSLICSSDVIPVETSWATFFQNDDGSYDVGILLLNKNSATAPRSLKVTVFLKSVQGEILYQKEVTTPVPLATDFPIVIQNIALKEVPDKVIVVKEEEFSYVLKTKVINPLKVAASFDRSSANIVHVTITNPTKKDFLRFPVYVVLYDESKKPLGVAESYVERLLQNDTVNVDVVLGKHYDKEPALVRGYVVTDPYAF